MSSKWLDRPEDQPKPRTGVPVMPPTEATVDPAAADTLPGDGVRGWIPNAVDIRADKPTGYAAPHPYGKPDEWMSAEVALQRGMDPRYLTPEDQDRLAAMDAGAKNAEEADCATYLRAAIALAKQNTHTQAGEDAPAQARRWAIVRTKAEEALLYALFGDRVG